MFVMKHDRETLFERGTSMPMNTLQVGSGKYYSKL